MMKRYLLHIMAGVITMIILLSSCQQDAEILLSSPQPVIPEGYIPITFRVDQSDMNQVESRSVDPDGQDINSMTLFCFNAYGLFLATADQVELTKDSNADSNGHHTSGSYTANIPQETAIIHFVANQASGLYDNKNFINKTEAQVMADMEGASGMMIYWYRFAKKEKDEQGNLIKDDLKEQLAALEGGIKLIRNQAKVTINGFMNDDSVHPDSRFTVTGYIVTNIHAFGTVAPFCPQHGFAVYDWPSDHVSVTLPAQKAMMSDITDINTKSEDYIFEHENTLDNPVSVIIKGRHAGETKDLYYRAMIMDQETGNMIPILRNHHYKISIVGALAYGKPTFEEALNGPATNNVWVSVDSWVKEVMDNQYRLSLEKTSQVFHADDEGKSVLFNFKLTDANGRPNNTFTAPEVTWLEGNNVALHERRVAYNEATGEGTINITLAQDDENTPEQSGTLMIRKGRLYRTIDISMISTQKFTPAWVAAQVYGQAVGENVTLKFTIPETCPESLFPFPVMISVNDLDVRPRSGMVLPIRLPNEATWYGEPNDLGYKYEYIVDKPGVHRLYFHSILPHNNGEAESITIEANFFQKLTKNVLFVNHQRTIAVTGLKEYESNIVGDGYAQDEPIRYVLVPQKINAPVVFDLELKNLANNSYINAGNNDEFLIYSKSLNHYEGDKVIINGQELTVDCEFGHVADHIWKETANGRVAAFRPLIRGRNPIAGTGKYSIYMFTNKPISQDVIRISSNVNGSKAYWNGENVNTNDAFTYGGNTYRSTIFELANNYPFRFAAQVQVGSEVPIGTWTTAAEEEKTETIEFSYQPNQQVILSLDVTSFKDRNGNSVHPFGTEFEIYIDAPMFSIDTERFTECKLDRNKLKPHPSIPGRFIYTVNADREIERTFGMDDVKIKDETGTNQNGERKLLPFRTNGITSAGDITISSDQSKVVYFTKKFKVKNRLIEGTIKFDDNFSDNIPAFDVPKDAFVAFVRKKTNTRIGSITVYENGKYRLNLRKEYEFAWENEEIEFDYKHTFKNNNGNEISVMYDLQVKDLKTLFENPNVVLKVATETRSE